MQLEQSFTVAAPVEQAWALLLDIERIAPCMPGATLTSFAGDDFEGNVRVKLGPVSLTYAGKGRFLEKDDQARRMVMEASGRDNRGGGTAKATVTGTLQPAADGPGPPQAVVSFAIVATGRPEPVVGGLGGFVASPSNARRWVKTCSYSTNARSCWPLSSSKNARQCHVRSVSG